MILQFTNPLTLNFVTQIIGVGNYENGHKNIFGLSVILELKIENSKILTFKVIFLSQKSTESFSTFFIKEYEKKKSNFCYCHFLITLIFNVVVFLKKGPIFNLQF